MTINQYTTINDYLELFKTNNKLTFKQFIEFLAIIPHDWNNWKVSKNKFTDNGIITACIPYLNDWRNVQINLYILRILRNFELSQETEKELLDCLKLHKEFEYKALRKAVVYNQTYLKHLCFLSKLL